MYRVNARYLAFGNVVSSYDSATMGDEMENRYETLDAAEARAEEMQDEIADYGLDPTTCYYAEEA